MLYVGNHETLLLKVSDGCKLHVIILGKENLRKIIIKKILEGSEGIAKPVRLRSLNESHYTHKL